MDATYVLDSSSYARRFTQRACALSENLEEVELALAELDFAPNRVPAITPGGLHRLLVWRGRILQLDRDFEQSQPSDFNIRLCIFLTDCLVLAKMSDAFSSTTGPSHKAKVTGVISFYKMEVVSTPNIGAFRNIVNLIFDEKSSLPVSFSSSVEKGEFLSKLTVKESSPQPAKYVNDRLAEDIRNKKTVPLFDDIEAVEIDASKSIQIIVAVMPTFKRRYRRRYRAFGLTNRRRN
ncbi:hypothetical protein BC830DRAFT_107334 [Chytriomyces sp. MP71]|nr:hypothetical protein BC830DRAFT_107334 [Chytriomyces sp. MP71]